VESVNGGSPYSFATRNHLVLVVATIFHRRCHDEWHKRIAIFLGGIMKKKSIEELKELSAEIRLEILEVLQRVGSGHPGGSLSCVELVATLYNNYLTIDPENLNDSQRDRFILSKGHASLTQYLVMAKLGFYSYDEIYKTFREIDSHFQAHPSMRKTPGIEACTGSLGQGLSIGNGMALGLRECSPESTVYVILGDGECQEGQVWEAAMSAVQFKLSNLVAIIDRNKVQLDGMVEDIKGLGDLEGRLKCIGWNTRTINGHALKEIIAALDWAKTCEGPTIIIADTIKGKGVPLMEGKHEYHGSIPPAEVLEREIERMKEERV
jgi:transketolase